MESPKLPRVELLQLQRLVLPGKHPGAASRQYPLQHQLSGQGALYMQRAMRLSWPVSTLVLTSHQSGLNMKCPRTQAHNIHSFRKPAEVTRHTFSTGDDYTVSLYFGKVAVACNSQKQTKESKRRRQRGRLQTKPKPQKQEIEWKLRNMLDK